MSAHLEKRLAELNQEIRTYPGPIARCDQHLPALLDERAKIIAELEREGVVVRRRIPSLAQSNPHNIGYLRTKRERTGHLIDLADHKSSA